MLLGGILISEILADPNGVNNFDTDGNGVARGADEFIELHNISGAAIDISGLELWDAGRGNWFTFPPGSVLQPDAHAMVMRRVQPGGNLPTSSDPDDLFFDAAFSSNVINNGRDNVVVYDPANDEFIQALFNNDTLDDPTATYSGFSGTATRNGAGEDFGSDIDGFSIQRIPEGSDTFVNNMTPTPGTKNVCFTRGTLMSTPTGETPIERLDAGDLLLTKDHGPQKIVWIWAKRQSVSMIRANPALRAVRIAKGVLGNGLPRRTLDVSRHHRMLASSKIVRRMFETDEILVPAKDLLGIEGVELLPANGSIVYYHILMENHEILYANGAAAESLYLGEEAVTAMQPEARAELQLIFGNGWETFTSSPPQPARKFAKGRKVLHLALRHRQNRKPLVHLE